jgi:nucleoside-diphosphate-sugar epimerase
MPECQLPVPPTSPLVVVTGAAGLVGTALVTALVTEPAAGPVRLRLCDLPGSPRSGAGVPGAEVESVHGDLADPAVADQVLSGADAVVHLAGQPRPDAPWPDLVESNVLLTAAVLDAASRQAVARVVLAGSVHAGGDVGPAGWPLDPAGPARPCCRYGVSKATAELLARNHARGHPGTSAVTLRLGLVARRPRWRAEALGWTPLDALAPWVLAALRAPAGYHCVYAVATPDGARRYGTGPTSELLGHERRVRPEDVDGLPGRGPELAAGCRLWRHGPDPADR